MSGARRASMRPVAPEMMARNVQPPPSPAFAQQPYAGGGWAPQQQMGASDQDMMAVHGAARPMPQDLYSMNGSVEGVNAHMAYATQQMDRMSVQPLQPQAQDPYLYYQQQQQQQQEQQQQQQLYPSYAPVAPQSQSQALHQGQPQTYMPAAAVPPFLQQQRYPAGGLGASAPVPAPVSAPAPENKLNTSVMPRPPLLDPACGEPRALYMRHGPNPHAPPRSNSAYIGIDDGSAIPRFVRLSTNAVAVSRAMHAKSAIPFGALLMPFARVAPGEYNVREVDMRTMFGGGPLRCSRCRAYANPGFKFLSGGAKFECNLCRQVCDTPPEHMGEVDRASGLRVDALNGSRPEFQFGSVEYIVGSADYLLRPPKPPAFVFVIDVSASSLTSGLAAVVINTLRYILNNAEHVLPGYAAGATVSIVTYDRGIQFYDCRQQQALTQEQDNGMQEMAQILHVVDVDDPFVPLGGEGFFCSPKKALAALDAICAAWPALAPSSNIGGEPVSSVPPAAGASGSSCLGSALAAINMALEARGGKVFAFVASMPTIGLGKLERRGAPPAMLSEQRETDLLKASADDFYGKLGSEMGEKYISVDLFLCPSSIGGAAELDVASLAPLPKHCGGVALLYARFEAWRDGDVLSRQVLRAVSGVHAFEAMTRVRVSPGLECTEYFGNFTRPLHGHEILSPVMSSESCVAVLLNHEDDLEKGASDKSVMPHGTGSSAPGLNNPLDFARMPCIQSATLYTDPNGQRRIRVHTVFAQKTSSLADVFKFADVDCVLALLAKRAAQAALSGAEPVSKCREAMVRRSILMLYVYRKFCATAASSGQLILPEALKVLPVCLLGLSKSCALSDRASYAGRSGWPSVDERAHALSRLGSAPSGEIAALAYPRIFALESLPPEAGEPLPCNSNYVLPDPSMEPVALPNALPAGSDQMEASRVLLIEDGLTLTAVVGAEVNPDILAECFEISYRAEDGAPAVFKLRGSVPLSSNPPGEYGMRVQRIVEHLVESRFGLVGVRVLSYADMDANVHSFVEDKDGGFALSYVEFLKYAHRKIMDLYSKDTVPKEFKAWENLSQGWE
ncbi:Protein transport protein Sec24-like CEF [Porphyridium purpureum]|uniref:Protein transport protein Sec24-like CEF n=1 Tax=Porphyridium purpureum TaxID=35688 RepID=A0A5J4YZA8_PORPP|nr:Protein transport protein Sec24-like CEF [Porphyridium purpureum]|eukprot:POR3894..scf208_2